ncbi:MAG TPA: hypothetical protein VNA15_07875 [Candidatus Angelobacter sp.]|nr:hypothetical protein [Candidatus Angelobacter sp.]
MSELPTTTEVYAFALFFVPGYVSINIGARLVGAKTSDLSWLEKVILSFVSSLAIFLLVFVPFGIQLSADNIVANLPTWKGLLIFPATIGMGFVLATGYYFSLRLLYGAEAFGKRFKNRLELETLKLGAATQDFLNTIWENRTGNDLILETKSKRIFRGQLGAVSFEPSLDLLLIRRDESDPLTEFTDGIWVPPKGMVYSRTTRK